ncbi:MAG: type I-U CRISPR-associated protein Csx17 [Gammaproteobacteria bacterium]|nr:type I-U CRISPR-associated protein Csx17 [Gammaproteobacteria bacterium]
MGTEQEHNSKDELETKHSDVESAPAGRAAATHAGAEPAAGLAEHGVRTRTGESQTAGGATQTADATIPRFVTAAGTLSYAELAERLSEPLQQLDYDIRQQRFSERAIDETLLLDLHAGLTAELFPEQAGLYRQTQNQIRGHQPPPPYDVPRRMRDYCLNLATRIEHLGGEADDRLLELLAYAEGEFLSIHPFPDLNGRISRLWLLEILRRLQLPPVTVVPMDARFRARYFDALAAADGRDWRPLMDLWKERLSQPVHVNEIPLPGCTPTPLASYLKALAILRLVAEAGDENGGDAEATGFWRNDVFVLRTRLTAEQLREFFLEHYRPTPLVAPWGARSGFYGGSAEKAARAALNEIETSTHERLKPFCSAIHTVRNLLEREGFNEKASDEKKLELLNISRSKLPDELLQWLDACYVLTTDGRQFPPLLGTGGNEGSGSYVSGFAQQICSCVAKRAHDNALGAALFCEISANVNSEQTPGHFSPQDAGGANASNGFFEGKPHTNPWDYILTLEGTLLFAGSATRRSEFAAPQINFPFVVAPAAGGNSSYVLEEEQPKQAKRQVMEIWCPLWTRACALDELRALFSEGRATLGARAVSNGLDFARAIATLGVDRGIEQFQRFSFLMRNGQSFFATPLARYFVRANQDANLITNLEHRSWLASARRYARKSSAPNAFRSAARRLDTALFALSQQSSRGALQNVLRQLGRIETALSRIPKTQDAVPAPVPQLPSAWAIRAGGERMNDSPEFRIAAALAGLRLVDSQGHRRLDIRTQLANVSESLNKDGDRAWASSSALATWGPGPLTKNLGVMLRRRRLEAAKLSAEGEVLSSVTGATCGDVAAFLAGTTDDVRIDELLGGLACVDLYGIGFPAASRGPVLPPAFALLKIFFTSENLLYRLKLSWLPEDRPFHLPAEIPARLAADDVEAAVRIAWQRLRAYGVKLPGRDPPRVIAPPGNAARWLAALCIPLTPHETKRLIESLEFEAKPSAETATPQID